MINELGQNNDHYSAGRDVFCCYEPRKFTTWFTVAHHWTLS